MKTTSFVLLVLLVGTVWPVAAQTGSVTHNSWTSGAPIPTAVWFPATAVLGGKVYLVGGCVSGWDVIADTQIYDPATESWSTGASVPSPTCSAVAAVVKNVLYVIGGSSDAQGFTVLSSVWAYSPKTKEWSAMADMPTARDGAAVAVVNNTIYVIGGNVGGNGVWVATVESYTPATNTWQEESPMLTAKTNTSAGLFGSKTGGYTIVDGDGYSLSGETGDNEAYDVLTNTWSALSSDPTPRDASCSGAIGSSLYVAGGRGSNGVAIGTNESFKLSKNKWSTLAAMPQATAFGGSAVYKGQLYCFGGSVDVYGGTIVNNVQIYQP